MSLTLFCATQSAQQADYFQAPAPADASYAIAGGSADQAFAAGPAFEPACGGCATTCGGCEPWRLCPQCDWGLNFFGWLNADIVGNTSSPTSKFNGPHNAVDRSVSEDQSRIRTGHAGANFCILRRTALSLLKNNRTLKVGVMNKRLPAG